MLIALKHCYNNVIQSKVDYNCQTIMFIWNDYKLIYQLLNLNKTMLKAYRSEIMIHYRDKVLKDVLFCNKWL